MPQKPDVLKKLEAAKKQLEQLGITSDQIEQVMQTLHDYGNLQQELQDFRAMQFYDDAKELLFQTSTTHKNDRIDKASEWLRGFAEHIAGYVVDRKGLVVDLVDTIPALSEGVIAQNGNQGYDETE